MRLQTRKWDDKSGQTRYTTEVIANQLLFLGSPRDQSSPLGNSGFSRKESPSASSTFDFRVDSL
jgi:single-strand DNA-binding protein